MVSSLHEAESQTVAGVTDSISVASQLNREREETMDRLNELIEIIERNSTVRGNFAIVLSAALAEMFERRKKETHYHQAEWVRRDSLPSVEEIAEIIRNKFGLLANKTMARITATAIIARLDGGKGEGK